MAASMNAPKKVLLVEDEPLIAMMLEDFVDIIGHEVTGTADTVATALPLVEAGGIDVAILDVNLRGGEQSWPIADALADRGVPIIFASGGGDGDIVERHRGAPRLDKPFTMDSVERALAAITP
jgi:DNA-binding response OmpR family regulator